MNRSEKRWRLLRRAIFVVTGLILAGLFMFELNPPRPTPSGEPPMREFGAFYAVGYVLNHYPAHRVYDAEFYQQVHRSLFPNAPPNHNAPYGHAPFEAVVFKPFAMLPYTLALRLWQATCLALYSAGFLLLWRSSVFLPAADWPTGLLVFLSFECVCMESIVRGQVNAIPFIFVCVAMYCVRKGANVKAGAALAGCLCKPTLLLLILPMLAVTRQVRTLLAFTLAAGVLAAVSLLIVGWEGLVAYVNVVLTLGRATGTNAFASPFYVDFNNFFRMLTFGQPTLTSALFVATAVPICWLLVRTWRRLGRQSEGVELLWPLTLTWTMLVNVYATTYDTTLAIAGLVLTADQVRRYAPQQSAVPFWAVVTAVYVASWSPTLHLVGAARLQVFTLGLAAVGAYQLYFAATMWKRFPATVARE